jgi:hypothetical protein
MVFGMRVGSSDAVLGVRYFSKPSAFATAGATYAGEMVDCVPHGHGTMEERDGDRYDGDWRSGKRHGRGRSYSAESKNDFEGTWNNGVIRS